MTRIRTTFLLGMETQPSILQLTALRTELCMSKYIIHIMDVHNIEYDNNVVLQAVSATSFSVS